MNSKLIVWIMREESRRYGRRLRASSEAGGEYTDAHVSLLATRLSCFLSFETKTFFCEKSVSFVKNCKIDGICRFDVCIFLAYRYVAYVLRVRNSVRIGGGRATVKEFTFVFRIFQSGEVKVNFKPGTQRSTGIGPPVSLS